MVFSHRRPPVFGGGPQRVRHQGNPDTAVNPKSIPQFEAPNTPLWIGNNDLQDTYGKVQKKNAEEAAASLF